MNYTLDKNDILRVEHDCLMEIVKNYQSPTDSTPNEVLSGEVMGIIKFVDIAISYIDAVEEELIENIAE